MGLAKGHLWKHAQTAPARYQVQLHLLHPLIKQSDSLALPTAACFFLTPFFVFDHSFVVALLCWLGSFFLVVYFTGPLFAFLLLQALGLRMCIAVGWLIQLVGFALCAWGVVIAWNAP